MTTSYPPTGDQPLVHESIRRVGRPTAEELAERQGSPARGDFLLPARIRRHLARLITRW